MLKVDSLDNLRLIEARGSSSQKISQVYETLNKLVARNCQAKRLTSVQKAFEVQETAQQKNWIRNKVCHRYAQHTESSAHRRP